MADKMDALLDALVERMTERAEEKARTGVKHDLPSGFSVSTNLIHGPQGILGAPGIEQNLFGSRITPQGLFAALPATGRIDDYPVVGYISGFTAGESGDEQTYVCDDPLRAGEIKSCFQGSVFGRFQRKTSPLALADLGRVSNRSEFLDLRMVNPVNTASSFAIPGMSREFNAAFGREVDARLLVLAAEFEMWIAQKTWTGAVANNTSGGYSEFVGLETLVGTGKVDVFNQTACPSLDSDVKDFNYKTVSDNADELVTTLTMIWRYVNRNAVGMNFGQVQWVFVMRLDLFNELTDVWPCAYNTYRCNTASTSQPNFTNAREMVDEANAMRNGRYLKIDGLEIPVIIDDGIPEDTSTTNANVPEAAYASDIYLLPLTVRGGLGVLYYEYFDRNVGTAGEIAAAGISEAYVSDNGRFLNYLQFTNGCFSIASILEARLRLLTPQLAGRLQNVVYAPLQHLRQPFTSDSYFVDGGNTSIPAGSGLPPYAVGDVS